MEKKQKNKKERKEDFVNAQIKKVSKSLATAIAKEASIKQTEEFAKRMRVLLKRNKVSNELSETIIKELQRINKTTFEDLGETSKMVALLQKLLKSSDMVKNVKVLNPTIVPEKIEVKEPKWYKPFVFPLQKLLDGFENIMVNIIAKVINRVFKVDLDKYTTLENPLAVRLVQSQKQRFYTAGAGGFSGAPGTGDLVQKATDLLDETALTLTNKNSQYTYTIPDNAKALAFHLRSGSYNLHYSFEALAGGNYRTLEAGATYSKDNIDISGKTLYLRCPDAAGEVVEIEVWG